MRNKWVLMGLALVAAGAAYGAIAVQSWKGMIVAQPGRERVPVGATIFNLAGYSECDVLIEDLPEDLKDALTSEDIEGWVTNRLKNMGIRVVTEEERYDAYIRADKSTDERKLTANDRWESLVYVNLNALREKKTGVTSYSLRVECDRGVFVQPGYFTRATVWDIGSIGYFSSQYDAKERIREQLNELLDELERVWKICNP